MTTSVIIVLHGVERDANLPLAALRRQTRRPDEVIVVISASTPAPSQGTIVTIDRWDGPHAARNAGAEAAQGDVLAFLDADCVPDPEWLERLAEPLERGAADLVGGAVGCEDDRWLDRGGHRAKFGLWAPHSSPGDRITYPTANLAVTRAAWERTGPFAVPGWSGDTELVWRARDTGARTAFAPGAVVRHSQRFSLGELFRERRQRGRAFARLRRPSARTVLASPVTPLVLLARTLKTAATAGELRDALVTAPAQLLGQVAWTVGETGEHVRRLLPHRR